MAFTEKEKGRIRHFLGFPSWSSMANGIQLGFPAGSQPLFLLEQAFNRLLPEGEESVRRDLCECESVESQMGDARKRRKASKLGDLTMNATEMQGLKEDLVFWQQRLGDDLGVVVNPYGSMSYNGMGGGMNASVQS